MWRLKRRKHPDIPSRFTGRVLFDWEALMMIDNLLEEFEVLIGREEEEARMLEEVAYVISQTRLSRNGG